MAAKKKKRKSLAKQLKDTKQRLYSAEKNCEDLLAAHNRDVDVIKVKDVRIEQLAMQEAGLNMMLNTSQAMTGRLLMQLAECKCKADLENIPLHVRKWSVMNEEKE